ncbi:MAG: hypothetical protein EBV15_07885 [Bacteroidetes bacterium]|nr:hypothetical protein [Bacteroidota bacterium]
MTDLQRLETAVIELLEAHECVIIPNFGAFLLRLYPASANPFSGEIKPSGQTLFFNPAITADDGILLTYWRQNSGCNYATAQKHIIDLVQNITEKVKSNRSLALGKLGNFYLHNDGKMLFLPTSPLNLSKEAFGLAPLNFKELINTNPVSSVFTEVQNPATTGEKFTVKSDEEFEEAEIVDIRTDRPKNKGFIWKVAASVCLISLSAAAIYFGKQLKTGTKHSVQVASHIPTAPSAPEKTEEVTESNKKATVFVYLTTAEEINKGMDHVKTGKGNIFICGGSYMSLKLAENECNSWKKAGIPAVIGQKRGSSLVKVVLGRFDNEKTASKYLEEMPINPGFHAGLLITYLQFQ